MGIIRAVIGITKALMGIIRTLMGIKIGHYLGITGH